MTDSERSQTHVRKPSVAVVGAGFAGLRCADVLLRHGYKVTIFEARDRLGGRVAQSDHLGHGVDLGPNWIHGSGHDPILSIAKQTGTELFGLTGEEAIFDADGRQWHDELVGEYVCLMWDNGGLFPDAFEYSTRYTDSIDPERSLYDFFEKKVRLLFTDLSHYMAKRKRETLLQTCLMWGAYVGSDVRRQSLKFFWLEKTVGDQSLFIAGTYSKILDEVARSARGGADVRLGARVEKVCTGDDGGKGGSQVVVKTDAAGRDVFDEVVVTVPLGYLKRHLRSMFHPPLPAGLTSAVDSLGYGNLDKVYITFPFAFWDISPPSTTTQHDHEAHDETTSDTTEDDDHFAGFTHWLPPSYASATNPAGWDVQGINLAALPASRAHPTLLFYVYGDCAKHIASIAASPQSSSERDAHLIDFFKPYFSRLPNYSDGDDACAPRAVLATAWTNDEFAGYGSYSNFQIGLQNGDKDIKMIRHGLPERHLWFAGEHTAPFDALGTTTGAYLSGEGVARRILEAYGLRDVGRQ